jgi:hypothetical protein
MSEEINNGFVMDWDSEIDSEGLWTLFPEGEYDFEVVKFERGQHPGSDKLPACPRAEISIKLLDGVNTSTIRHFLYLHSTRKWQINQFFKGIGDLRDDEPLVPNWLGIVGKTGRATVYIDKWTTQKGEERESNKISKFLPYDPARTITSPPVTQPAQYTPGTF